MWLISRITGASPQTIDQFYSHLSVTDIRDQYERYVADGMAWEAGSERVMEVVG